MAEKGEMAMVQERKQRVHLCPICKNDKDVALYGQQRYILDKDSIPSFIFRCSRCDFNFRIFDRSLSEIKSHFKVAPYSTDKIEQRWLKKRRGFYRYMVDLLQKPSEGKSLLDIGCAFGHFLDIAVQYGYRPFGTEVSEEMVNLVRSRRNYSISCRPLSDLQLTEKQFDVITFIDSFYYFENPVETLQACHKLLKPGGELLMRVTNRNYLARLYRLGKALMFQKRSLVEMPFWTTDDAISCHSWKSLAELMNKTGFRITKMTCIEKGKRIESLGLRLFYCLTAELARLTNQRIRLTLGVICLARKD